MSTKVKHGQYLFPVRDAVDNDKVTLIPVTKDFYVSANREICRRRKAMQRSGECRCPFKKLWKCDGDCERCRYHVTEDMPLALDAPTADSEDITLADTIADDAPLPEAIMEDKELLEALYSELDALDPEGRCICELLSRLSERDAAEEMGMSQSTFKRHWAKVKALLAERLCDFR